MGKPEPLGGNLSGWWSRRISHEHRLADGERKRSDAASGAVPVSLLFSRLIQNTILIHLLAR
ncbi:type II toxin-antitoxin system YoeB family toxin [Sphingobium sp. CR28]|uniref:type II toxin-antitoxin system YoeB family toxin n=1 Tax=Sphingobium sp. CR28 TaxID=3400272 RepID=UPI003FEEE1DA